MLQGDLAGPDAAASGKGERHQKVKNGSFHRDALGIGDHCSPERRPKVAGCVIPWLCLYGTIYTQNDADMRTTSILCLSAPRHPECATDCSLRGRWPVHSPHVSPYTRSDTIYLFWSQSPMQSLLPLDMSGAPPKLERAIGASILHDSRVKIVMNTNVAAPGCTFCLLTLQAPCQKPTTANPSFTPETSRKGR